MDPMAEKRARPVERLGQLQMFVLWQWWKQWWWWRSVVVVMVVNDGGGDRE
jgi:hypothetical protein